MCGKIKVPSKGLLTSGLKKVCMQMEETLDLYLF